MSLSTLGKNHIDSAGMQPAASNNLVFPGLSSLKGLSEVETRLGRGALYQRIAQTLVGGFQTSQTVADFMATLALAGDHARSVHRFDFVDYVGRLLLELPLSRQLESVGHYYRALSLSRGARGDLASAGLMFEQVADQASPRYRARAMLALGTNSVAVGDRRTALSFYREVMRIVARDHAFEAVTVFITSRMTAVIRGMNGDHRGAVADLERMLPLARMASSVQPFAYYEYLNSLAVELAEVGRLDQARQASGIALASPFANAYPEWRETFDDIAIKQRPASRSLVAVPQHTGRICRVQKETDERHKLVRLPVAEPSTNAGLPFQHRDGEQARVLNFQQWKTMLKGSSSSVPAKPTTERSRMTTGEKLIRLMDLISRDETDDETIDRILKAVEEIVMSCQNQRLD